MSGGRRESGLGFGDKTISEDVQLFLRVEWRSMFFYMSFDPVCFHFGV
jgi:hypothetical protein